MAYRHPAGLPSTLTSGEFSAPSLRPFACAYRCDSDVEFVQEFLEEVLLRLMRERWEYTEDRHTVDLTTNAQPTAEGQQAASAGAAAIAGASTIASPASASSVDAVAMRTGRLSIENVIIVQLDAILRHPAEDKHFAVEIKSVDRGGWRRDCWRTCEEGGRRDLSFPWLT